MDVFSTSTFLLLLLLLLGVAPQVHGSSQEMKGTAWLQENLPNPISDPDTCRSRSRRLCDPDQVLTKAEWNRVEDFLSTTWYTHWQEHQLCRTVLPGAGKEEEIEEQIDELDQPEIDDTDNGMELQMAVALVQKMDISPFQQQLDNRLNTVVEDRAAETFARYTHDTWGVGIETESCGGAGVLLFLSIQDRAMYISRGTALEAVLNDRRLDQILEHMKPLLRQKQYDEAILSALKDIKNYIDQGPPRFWERFLHDFTATILPLGWIACIVGLVMRNVWKDSQRRREYARVESQLSEIDQARAQALQGRYQAKSCPICLEDFQPPQSEEPGAVATIGSDGQPLKLLRCGHSMDETCWAEWVSSGRGAITKCPICQQDVGDRSESNGSHHHPTRDPVEATHQPDDVVQYDGGNEERIMRQYRRERNFRLARLAFRYPQYVRPNFLQRATQPHYEGTLARDPGFVESNPALAQARHGNSGGMRSSGGFGGSASGGGRGGRW